MRKSSGATLVAVLAVVFLVIAAAAGIYTWRSAMHWLQQPLTTIAAPAMYEVPLGASVSSVAQDLQARGILEHPRLFSLWARFRGKARDMKAGEYELQPSLSPAQLLELFVSGQVYLHGITFVEGTTFADIRRLLAQNPAIKQRLGGTSLSVPAQRIMTALGAPDIAAEGQFFPDTYKFPRGTADEDILAIAHRRMQQELQAAWDSRTPDLPLANPQEALVLASIVEKETALESERALIAGVFISRLREGMRLQTDPTVIYGLGESFDGNLRRVDLLRDTPFNTYTRTGLPPTPICLPGAASLRAATRPNVSGALYFVATGNGDGSHHFSRSLPEHEKAVKRYLAKLKTRGS
jgi:UPF0755 protein